MTLLQKRKLKLIAKRIIRNDKKRKLYLLNLHWLKIKKQKLRRRRKTFIKTLETKKTKYTT
jgi:hypothetical protein